MLPALAAFSFFVILIGNLTLITANVVRSNVIFHISDATCPSQQHHGDFRAVKAHENAVPEGTLPHYLLVPSLQLELHLLAGAEMWPFLECHPLLKLMLFASVQNLSIPKLSSWLEPKT